MMNDIRVQRRRVSRTGRRVTLQPEWGTSVTVITEKYCVVVNDVVVAEARSEQWAKKIRDALKQISA